MSGQPPLWSVFAVQAVSVLGDQFGQRASRKDFHNSGRRMLLALTLISGTQILLVLGILQAVLPASITGTIYGTVDGESGRHVPCYREVDIDGHLPSYCEHGDHVCHPIPCPAQGPGSMFKSIGLHPLLLLNGIQNIAYYVGEVMLYHHPLGLVLIVLASLTASFVMRPLETMVGLDVGKAVPPGVIILGVLGAMFCVIERRVPGEVSLKALYQRAWSRIKAWSCYFFCCRPVPAETWTDKNDTLVVAEYDYAGTPPAAGADKGGQRASLLPAKGGDQDDEDDDNDNGLNDQQQQQDSEPTLRATARYFPIEDKQSDGSDEIRDRAAAAALTPPDSEDDKHAGLCGPCKRRFGETLKVFFPFCLLSVTYGMWFVTQKLFNDKYRTNIFGYTCIDQVLAPVYMYSYVIIVDSFSPFRSVCVADNDKHESWWEAIKGTFSTLRAMKGRAFFTVFLYRLLINARAMGYFYMGVVYDLDRVYLELTLVRIVLSWMATFVVCLVAPKFIDLTSVEKNTIFAPSSMAAKAVGSCFILGALIMLNQSDNG